MRVSGGHLYEVEAPTEAAAEKRVSGGHLYEVEAPTEAAAEIGVLDIPFYKTSLHLMREVDFAKQKTEGEKNQNNILNQLFLSLSFACAQQLPRQREPDCHKYSGSTFMTSRFSIASFVKRGGIFKRK